MLILFYLPWCGHCITLFPVIEELSRGLISSPCIVAKFDLNSNSLPKNFISVESVPALVYVHSTSRNAVQANGKPCLQDFCHLYEVYNGTKTLEDLSRFVLEKKSAAY